jgi:hypothetical protein
LFPAASPESPALDKVGLRFDALTALAVVLLYAAMQVVLYIGHDPWLDEAQAWLLVKTFSRPIDWLVIPGEGHPPLWYWIVGVQSLFMDFNQARIIGLIVALANAYLLWRVLGRDATLLFVMLFSFVLVQFWGYQYRPYNIVFSCILGALLLDRQGKRLASTWLLALGCGFHFFTGLLFAFWLVYQRTRGTSILSLLPPSLVALVFGALAVLSGLGNTTAGPISPDLLAGTLHNLSWAGMIAPLRGLWLALATVAILVMGLYKKPAILATVLVLLLAFSFGTALIYGKYPWHAAFMTMLCFMAVMVAGLQGRRWVLMALMLPQLAFGIAGIMERLEAPVWKLSDLYDVISRDAGSDFDPARQLVAWPDLNGVAVAATKDVTLISGNDGALLGPIDWRGHDINAIDPALAGRPGPFWLICGERCARILAHLGDNGRKATLLAGKTNVDNGVFVAYRID